MSEESPILARADRPGKRISFALAITVHLLLAGFLFYGVRWQTKAVNVVEVDLVVAAPEPAAAAPQVQTSEIDDILDEIDGVLESNAEEFVRGFVQKGGQ